MSEEEVTETTEPTGKSSFDAQVEEATKFLEELKESGLTELQDQARELSNRFPAAVVTRVLHISGRQIKHFKNPDKRIEEASDATALEFLQEEARELTKEKLKLWLEIGKAVEALDIESNAKSRGLSIPEYIERASNFYVVFFPLIRERVEQAFA
jgi:hypothetical protein